MSTQMKARKKATAVSNCDARSWGIIGHAQAVSLLQTGLRSNLLSHAYLLSGPEHIGKTTLARVFGKALLCHESDAMLRPCNACSGCLQYSADLHPDVVTLERLVDEKTGKRKQSISIEQVREWRRAISLSPMLGNVRVAIVSEIECLTAEAANAVLKVIEEPGAHTIVVLIAHQAGYVLPTIASRCQRIALRLVPTRVIADEIASFGVTGHQAEMIATAADGLPGIAVAFAIQPETMDAWREQLGEFVDLFRDSLVERFTVIDGWTRSRNVEEIFGRLAVGQQLLHWMLRAALNSETSGSVPLDRPTLERLTQRYSLQQLTQLINHIDTTRTAISGNVNPRLALENLALNF